jgi:hypothetical protein
MEILQYTPDMQASVTQFYNRLIANVPHCYPVTEEEFAIVLRGVTTGKTDKNDDGLGLDSETAFVAITGGAVQAFIHVGLIQIRDEDVGVIRFLGYQRGARRVGQAVLERAEAYLKTFNVSQISAFPQDCRYRFYHFEHAYLSDALDQVQGLLGFNGYHRSNGEVFLDWEDYSVTPVPSSLPVTLSIDWKDGRGQFPNCTVLAHQNGEQVGICESLICESPAVVSSQAMPMHKTGFILLGSALKTIFRDKGWGVTCSNTRFKRCAKSDTDTPQLARIGKTTEHSSFIATAGIVP